MNSWRYSVDWCIAMYNMGTALMALPQHVQTDMSTYHIWAQAAAGMRYLAYYHMAELSILQQEQLKRLFWLHFVANMYAIPPTPERRMLTYTS